MSSFSMLPTSSDSTPTANNEQASVPEAYSLTVLVTNQNGERTSARCGNLDLPPVEAATVREALSKMVRAGKSLIVELQSAKQPIPWIEPPHAPAESESRFMVPLHT